MTHPERRLLISVDMERYSRRSNTQQYEAQRAFQELLREAAGAVGLDRLSWKTQQSGDGELTILPADTQEPRVIGRFVPELNRRLRAYNSSRVAAAQVRLRVALHQGLVHLDGENGFPGNAVTYVSRLCDAQPLKDALAAFPDAGVALIVSSDIYRDVVTEYPEELRPERFQQIEVHHREKDFREYAWICVIDEYFASAPVPAQTGLREPELADRGTGGPAGPDEAAGIGGSGRDGYGAAGGPGRGQGGIRTGDIQVTGQNAIGHGAQAIGSVNRGHHFGEGGRSR
ncbi:hypothetical protein [Micromonospora echinofusca]|uniref:Guanylate cyclase domain-containing protein n=1 Tax=Micromonospora echinofusca TaxID=47858 RepID=A0ABS3VV20_MICEH|nr:hypothetical protein [Micromonospora echinofusca]MBO4208374.1 hypothetical protein [Micromonospora echinofusca]